MIRQRLLAAQAQALQRCSAAAQASAAAHRSRSRPSRREGTE
jgi:hypothetical protein